MCHYCGAEQTKLQGENSKLENGKSLKLNGEGPAGGCRFCQQKHCEESMKQDSLHPAISPNISPTTSFSSSDRTLSSCSDISVDVNSYARGNQEEGTGPGVREDLSYGLNGQPSNSGLEAPVCNGRETMREVEIMENFNGQANDNCPGNTTGSSNEGNEVDLVGNSDMDAQIWEPPEAEDPEDEFEGSVAFNDDEECGDGTEWGKPSSLSCCSDEGKQSFKLKEEKQKAMEEVTHSKFKAIVSHLLKTAGVASLERDGESWVDIVTSLSWEAASFLKPDATDGKAMDPDGYVKVKCIATGFRSESQVVKGLVFKKQAAHKHMPRNFKNPRLLLVRGVLGQSCSGFSSFKSIEQEMDNLKSLVETIEMCHPNVLLVEKSVSRDVQEFILAKGMTLVYDMKLHRLERVARATGSPILSSSDLLGQKLKQCDSFHIERFVEEHNGLVEGGKKPSKTLMFIEGCPTRLGCTILLKGSHSEELKKIKHVLQIVVIMAYHLILETSFLLDWRAMFSNTIFSGVVNSSPRDEQCSTFGIGNSSIPSVKEFPSKTGPPITEIPISDGLDEHPHNLNAGLEGSATISYVPYNPVIITGLSSLSSSLKKVVGLPLSSSAPSLFLSNYFGFCAKETNGQIAEDVPVSETLQTPEQCDMEVNEGSNKEKLLGDGEPLQDTGNDVDNNEDEVQSKDDINGVLDSQSILVLMSSRNALRGTICEQSHFSHIKFYKHFDVPLGKFFRDNLLNQRSQCTTCGELPEAHIYYYAHHNKQLTIHVKRLPKVLPGEAEGKIWMWIRCIKCKHENGIAESTKRVLLSTAARSLSFGKFLELSFSVHSSSGGLSYCGHSLDREFLYFFGFGPMAAMFKCSRVRTYTVSLPPQKLEFIDSVRHDGLKEELHDVRSKGLLLFSGVADTLKKLRSQFAGSVLNLHGSVKEFSDIEDILKKENSEFEVSVLNSVAKNGNTGDAAYYKVLSFNQLLLELLLQSFVWERRLQSLLLADPSVVGLGASKKEMQHQFKSKMDDTDDGRNERTELSGCGDEVSDNNGNWKGTSDGSVGATEVSIDEIPIDAPVQDLREQKGGLRQHGSANQELSVKPNGYAHHHSDDGNCPTDHFALSHDLQVEGNDPVLVSDASKKDTSPHLLASSLESSNGFFWMPFSEIRLAYMKELQRGFIPKFQSISSYIQEHIPAAYQLISEEGQRLHIPLGIDNYIVRDYDGELSSIIACALAFLNNAPLSTEAFDEYSRKEGGISAKSTESLHILTRVPTKISPHWSSNGSSDTDSIHSMQSLSAEETNFSSFDGVNLLDTLSPLENLSPEVSLGVPKSGGKGKYSVICLYAKPFRDLRSLCCWSELDYIASLSRCKNWDAKGGKSRSFFAKTLDDRFIIKEIKRTEFESFMKFAPQYFKYMNESYELGNQSCLAKVLGIYQVILRQTKSGKEVKHDLMVMENLTFGRSITRQYDLKGALHARYNSAADGAGDVLLDQNFVNDMNSSPLYVSKKAKRLLERAVWNDTNFLYSINVMDYSLLVGVDPQRRELACGIIDFLRQYTWDKQLETWVKTSLVVPRNVQPTVISPIEYRKRFRKFMSTHFLSVPDNWCSQTSSDPCKICGVKDDGSSE